jgi:putative peptidoglycan lipid II flippase
LALPVSALLLVEGRSVIKLLFEKNAWTANDTEMVTSVLLILTPMIFFYVARDLLTRVFYAFQDSRTPFAIAVIAIVVKIFLDWLFVSVFKLGISGIALATTLITIINLSLLFYLLRNRTGRLGTVAMIKPLLIMLAGSGLCGLASYYISNSIPQTAAQQLASALASMFGLTLANKIVLALNIGIASSAGLLLYVGICYVLRLEELRLVADKVQAKLKISRARP